MKQLREELKNLKLWFDSPHYKAPLELDDDAIDLILKVIESRLPEKEEHPRGLGGEYFAGYNQCLKDIRRLLSEK